MSFGPLISADAITASTTPLCLIDARAGADVYAAGHLEGAVHADPNRDLSTALTPGFDPARGGRHPLPTPATWAARLGAWGIGRETRVVAYDDDPGPGGACRLWWMLRAFGHASVAVLDGGLRAARAAGLRVTPIAPTPHIVPPYPCGHWLLPVVDLDTVARRLGDPDWKVLDVRARERWRGELEPLDPVAGRIPGTVNLPFGENLALEGRFKGADELRRMYLGVLGTARPEHLIVHCGSGVTACHTLLALERAGLAGAALYVGSYSEWCRSGRPLRRGADPRE